MKIGSKIFFSVCSLITDYSLFPKIPEIVPDCPKAFQSVWKLFQFDHNLKIVSVNFLECPETFPGIQKNSRESGNFQECP